MAYLDSDEEPQAPPDNSEADEKLLKEVRENYRYATEYWREAREERQTDMRHICGDPWPPRDRKAREDADRPVLNHDELSQYINQSLNNIRQDKRAIRVEPAGGNSNDQSAEYRQNRIRAIEYRSKANSVYETAFQQMLEGSYGFWRIGREWKSTDPNDWTQEITIRSIPNPDSVLYDPDCKRPDWSDARWCFVIEPMSREKFKKRWPDAQRTNFTAEDQKTATEWFPSDQTILVAEYWKVNIELKKQRRTNPQSGKVDNRTVEKKTVTEYITNGVEILEENAQPGCEIPIPCCIGLERYVDDAKGVTKRKIFSLVRLARDPQMMLAFLVSCEAEEAGLTPKTPFIGYTGQFESDRESWMNVTKKPYPYLQIDPIPDSANGQILPKPERESFTPNFAAYQLAKDSARRAIQAAMGISPLPTAAMRANEKSGIAIQRIQQEQALGSYHFVDNFERAIERCGRIIESWLPLYDSGAMDVPLCDIDDKRSIVHINEPVMDPQTGQVQHIAVEEGDHDVTISTGPSNASQRDAAQEHLSALIQNLQPLVQGGVLAPPTAAQLLAMSIKMLQLGPVGDQMVEAISPQQGQEQLPPQAQQAISQAQGQMQQMQAMLQELQAKNQQLEQERSARVIDNQGRLEVERVKADTQIAVAQINTQAQVLGQRIEAIHELTKDLHKTAHERGTAAAQHHHELRMAEEDRQHEREKAVFEAEAEKEQATLEAQHAAAQSAQDAAQQPQAGGQE